MTSEKTPDSITSDLEVQLNTLDKIENKTPEQWDRSFVLARAIDTLRGPKLGLL